MRQWAITAGSGDLNQVLADAIPRLGEKHFDQTLLDSVSQILPAASCSVYRTGPLCEPAYFMSASRGIPDTTRACWRAYLTGPYRSDQTLLPDGTCDAPLQQISHITAAEMPSEHRVKVYEAYGMVERVSIVERQGLGALFAINFYRHQHQRPFSDVQIGAFGQLAPALLALAHKHLALRCQFEVIPRLSNPVFGDICVDEDTDWVRTMQLLGPELTPRECQVCAGILQGLTFDGIACQMGLSVPTVKTYRNRAFTRLGLHFRNELFALVLKNRPC